jgi:hypothetical protein
VKHGIAGDPAGTQYFTPARSVNISFKRCLDSDPSIPPKNCGFLTEVSAFQNKTMLSAAHVLAKKK